jgi:glyoxylate reductase
MDLIAVLHHPRDEYAAGIVSAAVVRSFTSAQVRLVHYSELSAHPRAAVFVNPSDDEYDLFAQMIDRGAKALILGNMGPRWADKLGLVSRKSALMERTWAEATPDPSEPYNASPAKIVYDQKYSFARAAVLRSRYLARYDFTDEWNNMGYGRITCDGGPWSVARLLSQADGDPMAELKHESGEIICAYATVHEFPNASALWVNRPVGPVDSLEWRLVERFFGDHRSEDLICLPYLSEIPCGYQGAVSPRLDCDQAVAAARPLLELYSAVGIPLSLAALTGLQLGPEDFALLREVVAIGGSVASHSAHHYENWGGCYEVAYNEAVESKRWLEEFVPSEKPIRYAVSPFHQNPPYALKALADAGYKGVVGGIIHNDPELILGRAGRLPFIEPPMVSHTQQCMLHGDCTARYGGAVEPYLESFDNHLAAGAIFGYLDHPFSEEYQYGWSSEEARLDAHQAYSVCQNYGVFCGRVREGGFLQKMSPPGLSLIKSEISFGNCCKYRMLNRDELLKGAQGKDGILPLLTDRIDGELLDAAGDRLKIVANYAVGFNNIDVPACTERKIPATNTPGVLTGTTADMAMTLLLTVARKVVPADAYARAGKYEGWGPLLFLGADVHHKTLGVMGFGRIGYALAKRAAGFEMKILYHDVSRVDAELEKQVGATYVDQAELLAESDFVSLHVPLTPETRRLISDAEFEAMKSTAYLINTSRGEVVDEKALVRALKGKQIAGAGLDVFEREPVVEPELTEMDNVVLLPHIASASVETRTKMGLVAAENLTAVLLENRKPPNCLNPEVYS